MKIEKKVLPKSIIELILEADVKEVASNRSKVFADLRKNGNVK